MLRALLVMVLFLSSTTFAEEVPEVFAQEAQRHGLRAVVSPASTTVCQTLHGRFLSIGETMGYDRLGRSVFASKAVQALASGLAQGQASDFVDVNVIAQLAGMNVADRDARYLATAPLFGEAIGLSTVPLLIVSADDLKYLPFQQMNTDILLITHSAAELNKSRAERVAALAGNLNIRIHTLWTGVEPNPLQADSASALAWLAAATGGRFVGFSADTCLNRI